MRSRRLRNYIIKKLPLRNTLGKLPLGKLNIWEVATWENTLGKLLFGKTPFLNYLTSLKSQDLKLRNIYLFINKYLYLTAECRTDPASFCNPTLRSPSLLTRNSRVSRDLEPALVAQWSGVISPFPSKIFTSASFSTSIRTHSKLP